MLQYICYKDCPKFMQEVILIENKDLLLLLLFIIKNYKFFVNNDLHGFPGTYNILLLKLSMSVLYKYG